MATKEEAFARVGELVSAARSEPAQVNYVRTLAGLSQYSKMEVRKLDADGALAVRCLTKGGSDYVEYRLTGGPRYSMVSNVYATGDAVPNGWDLVVAHKYPADITLTGTYLGTGVASTVIYTATIGDTWTSKQFTTTVPNARVTIRHYIENRGGLWNLDLVEAPEVTGSFSTYNATATWLTDVGVLVIPTPGTYTLRGTFAGQDPDNPVATPRGWLGNETDPYPLVAVEQPSRTWELSPISNKDFAIAHRTGTMVDFVPFHGKETEVEAEPKRFYVDGESLDVAAMVIGEPVPAETFEVVQRIYGINTAAPGTNVIEVCTNQKFRPDGTYSVSGRWELLISTEIGSSYVMMLPLTLPIFDQLISTQGGSWALNPAQAPVNLPVSVKEEKSDGFAALSSTSDMVSAMQFENRKETRRDGKPGVAEAGAKIFIEIRAGGVMAKVYPTIVGSSTYPVLPAGTSQRFQGDFWYGKVPGVRNLLIP